MLEAQLEYEGLSSVQKATVFYSENSSLIALVLSNPKGGPKMLIPFWDQDKEDDKSVAAILSSLPDFDWSQPFLSNATPVALVHKVEELVLSGQLGVGALIPNIPFETADAYGLTANKVDIPRLPDGYEMREIRESDARHLYDHWKFNFSMSFDSYRQMLQILPGCAIVQCNKSAEKDLPDTESIRRQENQQSREAPNIPYESVKDNAELSMPVAWSHLSISNGISNTFTLPEFRRRGLSKVVTGKMADTLVRAKGSAFAFIEEGNEASVRLHEQLGFTKQSIVGWQYYRKKSYT